MTRRDFQVVADGVKAARAELKDARADGEPLLTDLQLEYAFNRIADNLATKLKQTNPSFNASLFKGACRE